MLPIIGFSHGLVNNVRPFDIPDDAWARLVNCMVFRRRLIKKWGTQFLCRLQLLLAGTALGATTTSGALSVNLLTILGLSAPASISLIDVFQITIGTEVLTADNGTLTGTIAATGTINYATGAISITGATASTAVSITAGVAYTGLPVMGNLVQNSYFGSINSDIQWIFDTKWAYNYNGTTAIKESTYVNSNNSCAWSGDNTNHFNGSNFVGSLFVSNSNSNASMPFNKVASVVVGTPTTITFASPHGLVAGDVLWLNEIAGGNNLNGVTCTVASVTNTTTVVCNFSSSGSVTNNTGIAQYLTSNALGAGDCIRYTYGSGFVNYCPPTSAYVEGGEAVRYICGCTKIVAFKSRLLLCGIYTTSSAGDIVFSSGAIAYSDILNPYYASLHPSQVPDTNSSAFYAVPAGVYGGVLEPPLSQQITNAAIWRAFLIVEYETVKINIVSTESALFPFIWQYASSSFGGCNPAASVSLDSVGLTSLSYGLYAEEIGFSRSSSVQTVKIDEDITDMVFTIDLKSNGLKKVVAGVDPKAQVIYFSFPSATNDNVYNDTTLVWNYSNNTWAQWFEQCTTPVRLITQVGQTWQSMTKPWYTYTQPWNSFGTGEESPITGYGNQQGYLLQRDSNTGSADDVSLYVSGVSSSVPVQISVANHNLDLTQNNFINISGSTFDNGTNIDGTYQVTSIIDANTLQINLATAPTGNYIGGGQIALLTNFWAQTKEFMPAVSKARSCSSTHFRPLFDLTSSSDGEVTFLTFANGNYISPANTQTASYAPLESANLMTNPDDANGLNLVQNQSSWVFKKIGVAVGNAFSMAFVLTLSNEQTLAYTPSQTPFALLGYLVDFKMEGSPVS